MSSPLRAPEIALGCPFSQAIDMWGVGCVLTFLYLADNLFPVDCDYQMVGLLPQTNVQNQVETSCRYLLRSSCLFYLQMKSMVKVLGQPNDHMLRTGMYTWHFFREEESPGGPTWRLLVR